MLEEIPEADERDRQNSRASPLRFEVGTVELDVYRGRRAGHRMPMPDFDVKILKVHVI